MTESISNRFWKLWLYLFFLVVPTLTMLIPALLSIDAALLFVNTDIYTQTIITSAALTGAFICYYFRLRFSVTFPIVLFLTYSYNQGMKFFTLNEFDSYYLTIRYLHLSILFIGGWLIGYGLVRFRYFPLLLSITVLTTGIITASDYNKELELESTVNNLFFVVLYAFYTYFIRETLENIETVQWRKVVELSARAGVFVLIVFLVFQSSKFFLQSEFKEANQAIGKAKKEDKEQQNPNEENMLNKNEQQQFDLSQTSQLKSRFGTNKELLFAAFVDNFFPNHPEIPNPLYFTCYHLTKYDTKNERFFRDPNVPSNDLFAPIPSKIPKYFTATDSSVIKKSKGELFHKIVESEIYVAKLSPQTFTAPSTAFSCQPINIDPDYKEQYTFAYKTKSYVSLLNSAYFIYNAAVGTDKTIAKFQEERINELKKVKNYAKVDTSFFNYYTEIPKGKIFDSIKVLGANVTAGSKTPIEKILKVRDYFTSKDKTGKPLFKYTLYPGSPNDPNIPNASMLSHFLFKNRKGYCTYFAASTLFMLRAVGIPVRMTTGFMIVDRSDKNKGWYFIYGDQAHAWVQVYFPEYGWLDFDTTIGNDDAQESPMPDGTPPMKPQKAIFAAVGKVIESDTSTQFATIELKGLQLSDKEAIATTKTELRLNLKEATITKGNFNKKFREIKIGDSVTVVSYDELLKKVQKPTVGEVLTKIVNRLPNPVSIDEVTIHEEQIKPKIEEEKTTAIEPYLPWWAMVLISIGILILLLVFLLLFVSRSIFYYYLQKAKGATTVEERTYYIFKAADFIYCQFGYYRGKSTPYEHAFATIQPTFSIDYPAFIQVYNKIKYDKVKADEMDLKVIHKYHTTFAENLFSQFTFIQRTKKFMNIIPTFKFFFN